ncbi:hypothetical protein CLAFUW4_00582 [Fulvia fulva]|uniref:Stc1 domain-containing protein n=1 Tax=Passalora fulva TaxID=5499 RepID=A0A9Q8L7I2_PASFU|nr:uncharacterized protein CLAFUR5_00581 [Fulvia fulva]KAK4634117.1 hypothetical protein CLAFUR4_00583 [Fulvia fulva]KAK4637995.1 hypothetical protein CLAFUR0_00584 [Fulvia fulva]UJO12277.1 hypothetical protein CLAFUR5_00581 [Fulvia fulva]WPV10249.1 hypothetical protein CLAFUW4_00582 [Fulvia fulva]WPV24608.1 hypothetical protein CLAFUW7_00587 [Fulvia fulva]
MRRVGPGFNPTKSAFICCMQCTTRQVVELNCHMCDKDKGIDKFFKAQRRNPDEAICISCQQDKDNYEPGAISSDESRGGGDDDEDSGDDRDDYSLMTDDMSSMSVSGNGTYPPARSSTTGGGGVALRNNTGSSSAMPSTGASASNIGSATSNATSRAAPSHASAARMTDRYGTAPTRAIPSVAGATSSTKGSGDWAKPKTVQRKVQYDVAQKEREERKAKENADDDEKEFCGGDSDSD